MGKVYDLVSSTLLGNKEYVHIWESDESAQREIAEYTFRDAEGQWKVASLEAEEQRLKDERVAKERAAELERINAQRSAADREYQEFRAHVQQNKDSKELDILQTELHDAIYLNRERVANDVQTDFLHRKLVVLQKRLIDLSRAKEARHKCSAGVASHSE